MILIINNQRDFTTDLICLWLNKVNKKYIRLSNAKSITNLTSDLLTNLDIKITGSNDLIKLSKIKSVFYKNSDFNYNLNVPLNYSINDILSDFIDAEWSILKEYLKFSLNKNSLIIGNIISFAVNKLVVLNIANKIGIKTPDTKIVTTKEALEKFRASNLKIITKPISEVIPKIFGEEIFLNYTRIIDKNEKIADCISPTLLQEYIEKKYEIRTYFLNNKFWSIAIFSQSQSQTKTDYRNYNYDILNRSEPFLLPIVLKNKIKRLMKQLHLNSGSIDFIYSTQNEFYFLEINPVGQFSNVSLNGNFGIEKYIAEKL